MKDCNVQNKMNIYMNIKFKEITENDNGDFELIAKWDNQDDIKYFIRPNFKEGEIEDITVDNILKGFQAKYNKKIYIILCNNKKIGYISIDTDFVALYKKDQDSAWIGICIGESDYRGMGISKKAMLYLEEKSRELNKTRIELGVFEYNERAIELYKKIGYKKIGENKKTIYYNGGWYNDIRMEKYI